MVSNGRMSSSESTQRSVADAIADFLASRGVERLYGLCGGHIMPIWDAAVRRGIQIIDVRHECAAVYMAHAEAELTGRPGVALVTAGPGLTNAVTGIANANTSRVPVVIISGRVPRPQTGMGGLQDMPQAPVVAPLCRRTEVVWERHHVLPRLDTVFDAACGAEASPGPAYIDFPTDLLREAISVAEFDTAWLTPRSTAHLEPDQEEIVAAVAALRAAQRPLVIAGRGARRAAPDVVRFLEKTGALYLDTGESRGAVPPGHPSHVPAMRGKAMQEADLVVTLERRLDFQVAYGSRAVFSNDARFIRIGKHRDDTAENRRDLEIRVNTGAALRALLGDDISPRQPDCRWLESMVSGNAQRAEKLASRLRNAEVGSDGRMHPYDLIAALNDVIDEDAIVVADGGDILSFARVALSAPTYLDPGPLGCLGIGVPFATSAALNFPGRTVVALIGDGSFGFTAMEIDTAVRTGARVLFVVANNDGWNIERHDMLRNYGGRLVGVELPGCRYDQLAQALGAHGERVEVADQLPEAIKRALSATPAVLDVAVTRDAVSPDLASGLAIVPDRHALVAWDDAERRRLASMTSNGDDEGAW